MPFICENCGKKIIPNQKKVFEDQLKVLIEKEFTAKEMAYELGVGLSIIYKRLEEMGAKKIFKLPKEGPS
jgi:DNA invertase Pin-like site-specific DNA recombinase